MKKNAVSVLCALLLCALMPFLPSCLIVVNRPAEMTTETQTTPAATSENTGVNPPTEKLSADEKASQALQSMVGYDMNGKTIVLATADSSVPKPSGTSTLIDGARWKVLNEVQDKYGISLLVTADKPADMPQKLKDAKTAGLYYADILLLESGSFAEFFADGLVADLSQMPFLTLDSEYYYPSSVASASVDGKVYGIAGEAGINPDVFRCLYVNDGLVQSLGLSDLCETVRQGAWTLDAMLSASKRAGSSDIACTGILSEYDEETVSLTFFEGCGVQYVDNRAGKMTFYSPVGTPQTLVAGMRELFSGGQYGCVLTEEEKKSFYDEELGEYYEPTEYELFCGRRSLFFFGSVYDARRFRNAQDEMIPLPVPKISEEQLTYVTPTVGSAMLFAIPEGSESTAEASLLIEALNVRAAGCLSEAYLNTYFYSFSRNERSVEMLSIILDVPYFDLAVNLNARYPLLAAGTTQTILQAITTGEDLLDVHFRNYYGALGALETIRNDAY